MKYVNPDSTHALNNEVNNEDLLAENKKPLESPISRSLKPMPLSPLVVGAIAAGAGAFACFAIWRFSIRTLKVRDLKVENLDVAHLNVERQNRNTINESGGVLRFDLGPSDYFENGLE